MVKRAHRHAQDDRFYLVDLHVLGDSPWTKDRSCWRKLRRSPAADVIQPEGNNWRRIGIRQTDLSQYLEWECAATSAAVGTIP